MIGTVRKGVKNAQRARLERASPCVAATRASADNRSAPSQRTNGVDLVLASTSRDRKELLARLKLPFEVDAPDVDEASRAGERPDARAMRLARAKADAVAPRWPTARVIGCDQVAHIDGVVLDKPGDAEHARRHLARASGGIVEFVTSLALLNTTTRRCHSAVDVCRVEFRPLSAGEIDRYVALDEPFDCAGAFRSESLGIALIKRIRGDDPSALVGLPLIQLTTLLENDGLALLA